MVRERRTLRNSRKSIQLGCVEVHVRVFNRDRHKMCAEKISRLPPKPLYNELYGQFYVPNDDMTDEEARTVRINLHRIFEVQRQKIRAAREGTVVDLFQDGNAETKQSARYLKKLDPSRAILKTAKVSCESLLKEATKCAAMVNRCGGRLAKSMNDGTFPYICVANSPAGAVLSFSIC